MPIIRIPLILLIFLAQLLAYGAFAEAPPRILSQADVTAYKKIFALQEDGHWKQADKLIKTLNDDILMGYVKFQRYMHPTKYRSRYLELRDWLALYNDHPGAYRVYRLARRRKPADYRNPPPPIDSPIPAALENSFHNERTPPRFKTRERKILNTVRFRVHKGNVTSAKKYVEERRKKISKKAHAQALGHIARGYYRYKKYRESIAAADKARKLAARDETSAVAAWWGGLAAWRLKDYTKAKQLFEHVGRREQQDEWLRAAGFFWAGRALDEMGQERRGDRFRKRALSSPHSFYGLLAAEALGESPKIDWQAATPKASMSASRLMQIPALKRVLALHEIGDGGRAEATLKPLIRRMTAEANVALLQWTQTLHMAHSSYAIAKFLERTERQKLYSALYAEPDWLLQAIEQSPVIDRAVVLGFVLQESAFKRRAKSSAGARGVMQLMPATASFVNGKRIPKSKRDILFDVNLNVPLGQKYMMHLLDGEKIADNLLLMIIAYNAGPGNLNKWRRKIHTGGDPLLFIESLPWRETRIYAERVMANIWMYRLRLQQATPSLTAMAQGYWPLYVPQDSVSKAHHAQNP